MFYIIRQNKKEEKRTTGGGSIWTTQKQPSVWMKFPTTLEDTGVSNKKPSAGNSIVENNNRGTYNNNEGLII